MESGLEYIKLFMEYESDEMPVVYFYEVDLNDGRFARREMEVFADRTVRLEDDPYRDVIEDCPIPTAEELNAMAWGEGFQAFVISREAFEEVWTAGIYSGSLTPG